ncbi:MAG: helix-turn-helix transcriptional regulator [Peptostreptococcaceae bacterium]|nr:helix-turn-helix transcriptional regulator [Peptostreptococcaceae bacterium]
MMIHAYDPLYLAKASRTIGNMLHDAVRIFGMDGSDFLKKFIRSGIAKQFETGNPKYISGKSGLELFLDVMEDTGESFGSKPIRSYERSDVYWVGWILAHYQWYSGRSFDKILRVVPYEKLLKLYPTLHEADIQKSYETIDLYFSNAQSDLKIMRKSRGLTQEALAEAAGVSVHAIRAYERKTKPLNKARFDTVMRLAKVLGCEASDLIQ